MVLRFFVVLPTRVGTKRSRAPLWPWRQRQRQRSTRHTFRAGRSPDLQRNVLQFHHLDTEQRHRAAKIATFRYPKYPKISKNIQKYPKISKDQRFSEICRSRYRTVFAIPLILVLLCLHKKYERIKQVLRHPVPGFDDAI